MWRKFWFGIPYDSPILIACNCMPTVLYSKSTRLAQGCHKAAYQIGYHTRSTLLGGSLDGCHAVCKGLVGLGHILVGYSSIGILIGSQGLCLLLEPEEGEARVAPLRLLNAQLKGWRHWRNFLPPGKLSQLTAFSAWCVYNCACSDSIRAGCYETCPH